MRRRPDDLAYARLAQDGGVAVDRFLDALLRASGDADVCKLAERRIGKRLSLRQLDAREAFEIVSCRKCNCRMVGRIRLHDCDPRRFASAAAADLCDETERAFRGAI